jgi:hypothetical protein
MCSPGQRFALLGASPGRAPGVEEGAGGGARGGGGGGEGEGTVEAEKDKMLVEKQKVIEELTWKLHQEQRQVGDGRTGCLRRQHDGVPPGLVGSI